jgi:hypothetical protein
VIRFLILNARRHPVGASSGAPTEDPAMTEVADDGPNLLNILNRLLAVLDPSDDGNPIPESRSGAVPERWEDQDYFYVEANLAGESESMIDISILNDLVLIRIAR